MIIAIQPDDYTNPATGKDDASSPRWAQLLQQAGHEVKWVDVRRADILEQIKDCDGFMWRHGHLPQHRQIARRLLPVIEKEMGIEVYPDQNTCWHYDDKLKQYYLLKAKGIAIPRTWIWFDYEQVLEWLKTAKFPMVIKLWSGAASQNVRLVEDENEAKIWVKRLFKEGLSSITDPYILRHNSFYWRLRYCAKMMLKKRLADRPWELHKNYVLFQEFIADNSYDTRVVIIGNRAFAKRRYNRHNDFRASGSGNLDNDPMKIDPEAIQLAFRVSKLLKSQSLALDILRQDGEHLVAEISYTYPSWSQYECPGHWLLEGKDIIWKTGHMWPEEAQIKDFLVRLKEKHLQRSKICV